MGRPALSAQEHFLHSTKSTAKANVDSHVPAGRPRIPSDIGPGLRRVFKSLCDLLSERRTLTRGDVELIRVYCFVYDRHKRNVKLLREEGEVTEYTRLDSNGQPHTVEKENLRVRIVAGAERQMAAILNQLGLTPTSKDRARPTSASTKGQLVVIPGSMMDTNPEYFNPDGSLKSREELDALEPEFKPLAPTLEDAHVELENVSEPDEEENNGIA